MAHHGTSAPQHVDCNGMITKVSIYLRWAQWLLLRVLKDRPHVIVNMDETGVSNVTSSKHGVIISRGRRNVPLESQGAKRARSSKITLLAVTCSSPQMQPHLPQVLAVTPLRV